MVLYQIRAIDARGFKVGILLTGHYGGLEADIRLLCEYYQRRTGSPLQLYAIADWEVINFEDYHGDHAGICETSQLMALRPELVDLTRKEPSPVSGSWAGRQFPLPDGRIPAREIGENIIRSQIKRLGEISQGLLASYKPKPGWTAPSLCDAANIWTRFEHLTRRYWWCSLTLEEFHKRQHVPFPGWEVLGE